MSAHPIWCANQDGDCSNTWHEMPIGALDLADSGRISVAVVAAIGDETPAIVQFTAGDSEHVVFDLDATQSRTAALYLNRAAEVVAADENRRQNRKGHAFTVERTNGDHFIWICRCGHVLVQDPGNTDILSDLIAHATGGTR